MNHAFEIRLDLDALNFICETSPLIFNALEHTALSNMAAIMEERAVAAPSTYSQPSRKGKKAWRKNVDITQLQQGLEAVLQETIHGGVVAETDISDLFVTDTVGDDEIAKQQQGKKLLKADEILAIRSAIPGVDGRKKRKLEEITVTPGAKRAKNGTYVSHKDLQKLRAVADGQRRADIEEAEHNVSQDPWDVPVEVQDERFTFLDMPRQKKEPNTLKQAPKPLTTDGKRIPNVLKPNAGKSYNPLASDWSALFEREGAAAVEAEKARLLAEADAEDRQVRAEAEAAKVEGAEKDEYATDYDSAWESEWEGFQSEGEKDVWTQKQRNRKTPAERKKVVARKERERLEKVEQNNKKRQEQEKKIRQIAKELSAKDKAKKAHAVAVQPVSDADSDSDGAEIQLRKNRFGRKQVPEAPLEVVLPDELEDMEDSLRRLKPEGNLLQDRYRNMLINGKVEVRKRQGQRKLARTTRTEKWSYKDWKLR